MRIGYPLVVSDYVEDKILAKHSITIAEVESAVRRPEHYVRKGRGVEVYEVLTFTHYGKHMVVVLRWLGNTKFKLITARPMENSEKRYYGKRRK